MGRTLERLRDACEKRGVGDADVATLELICDELISNVSRHAYGGDDGELEVRVDLDDERCALTLTDRGPAFDPTRRRDPDVTAPLEQREIGGLGIFLVRKKAHRMEYRRRDGRNELRVEVCLQAV
ncbi:MAG: ATP-binding protein [Acidobacteriota bacterium]